MSVFDCSLLKDYDDPSVLHPSSILKGDIVRLHCHVVLFAGPTEPPYYGIHAYSIDLIHRPTHGP